MYTRFDVITVILPALVPFCISFICCVICYCWYAYVSTSGTPQDNSSLLPRMTSTNEISLPHPLPLPVSPPDHQHTLEVDIANLPGSVMVHQETEFPPSYDDCLKTE